MSEVRFEYQFRAFTVEEASPWFDLLIQAMGGSWSPKKVVYMAEGEFTAFRKELQNNLVELKDISRRPYVDLEDVE